MIPLFGFDDDEDTTDDTELVDDEPLLEELLFEELEASGFAIVEADSLLWFEDDAVLSEFSFILVLELLLILALPSTILSLDGGVLWLSEQDERNIDATRV